MSQLLPVLYTDCMEEVKLRIETIWMLLRKEKTTGRLYTDVEFLFLQFRKVLELIALSSLVANKNEYEKQQKHFYQDWHAEKILNKLEIINPSFYPIPSKQIIEGKIKKMETINEGYLDKKEFIKLYDKCSDWAHAENPFKKKKKIPDDIYEKLDDFRNKIMTLLNHHTIHFVNNPDMRCCLMNSKDDSRVHVFEFSRIV